MGHRGPWDAAGWDLDGWFRPAYWEGRYILGGFAVADYWYDAPPKAEGPAPGRGVNIRMYDPQEDKWNIMWQHTRNTDVQRLEAKWEDGEMRLWFVNPDGSRATDRRITFFDITDEAWTWIRETSDDGGVTWKKAVKLSAKRRACG